MIVLRIRVKLEFECLIIKKRIVIELENPENILLKAEKQRIIWEEIQNLHPMKTEHAVPGVPIKSFVPENDTIRTSKLFSSFSFLFSI